MRGVWCVVWCGVVCSALLYYYQETFSASSFHFFEICAGRASETDDALWLGALLVHGTGRR